jgi:putative hydrolase of the HAD superfamily
MTRPTLIGLDADDTLWHNETLFRLTHQRFNELLAPWADAAQVEEHLAAVERRNLAVYGYGAKGFTLSMLETAVELSAGAAPARVMQEILANGRDLMTHPIDPLPGVREALQALAERAPLVLITKGDLFHQESKLARSGLADLFWEIEIVAEKDEATYQRILSRYDIDPATFVMVGNSVKSDILPVLALGGRAVHIEYETTWEMEHAEADKAHDGYWELDTIRDLPALLGKL